MADDASRVVIALIGDNSNLDSSTQASVRSFERGMSQIETSARSAEHQAVGSLGAIRFATRDLGFQISDIGTQLAGGQSPFLIFAQQGPQVTNALSEITAAGASLGTVLAGVALPALLAIVSVIGTLYEKSQEAADGHKAHEKAAKSLEQSIHDLDVALGKAVETTQESAKASYDDARAKFAQEVATRKTTIAILEKAKAERDAAANVGGLGGGTGGAALPQVGAQNKVDDLQAQLDRQNKALVEGARAVVNSAIPIVQQRVKEATDATAAANGKYERSLASLNAQFRKTGDAKAYQAALTDITRTRDAEIEAANKHERAHRGLTDAQREAAKAAREEQRAQEELQRTFDALTKALDPATANLDEYRQRLADIDRLVRAGKFNPDQAADLRSRALDSFLDTDSKQAQADYDTNRKRVLGDAATDPDFNGKWADKKFNMSDVDKTLESATDDGPFGKKAYDQQQQNIKSLAQIYESAFTGGAKGIGDALKRELSAAVAQALARLTISKLGSLLGGSSSGVGGFLSKLFGRASGGYVAPGQTVRVNEQAGGMELLRMGSEGGEVIPLGSTRASAPSGAASTQVVVHVQANDYFDAKVASISGGQIQAAAPQIAAGSARLSQDQQRRAARRRAP